MPTYRVTGPDGQTYTVTPPEGTNPSEDEILAQIRAQVGTAGDGGASPSAPTAGKPPLTTAQKIVRGGAGSTIGGAVGGGTGALLGSVVPGIGTAAGAIGGAMLGSAGGEAMTQYLDPFKVGIEEPSLLQIGLAGALPMVPTLARRFFMSLPGAASGLQEFLFKQLGDKGQRVVAQFAPVAGTADGLFKQARAAGAALQVPMPSTTRAAQEIGEEVAKSKFATGAARAIADRAQKFVAPGSVSFDDFRLNQSDVGALIRSMERTGGAALGRVKQLYGAMWDDLETALAASGTPTGATLGKAIDAFKREEAAKFVKDAWLKSIVRRVGQQNFDADVFLTKIDRARDVLSRLMPSAEIDDLIATLRAPLAPGAPSATNIATIAKTPRLGFEQVPFAERAIVSGSLGAVVGAMGGGPMGAGIGAGASILAVEAISSALTSAPGRAFVRMMAGRGMAWNQIGNVLLQGGRSAMTPDAEARVNAIRAVP